MVKNHGFLPEITESSRLSRLEIWLEIRAMEGHGYPNQWIAI
jgi:hypothetical protein